MDAVRFGRALGFGARQAAKTVVSAVDAARAENPSPATAIATSAPATPVPRRDASAVGTEPAAQPVGRPATATGRPATPRIGTEGRVRGIQEGIGRFKASAVEPVVRLSSVLWLEVMGVLFGIFALSTAAALWRQHAEWRVAVAHPAAHASVLVAAGLFALFAYFCV